MAAHELTIVYDWYLIPRSCGCISRRRAKMHAVVSTRRGFQYAPHIGQRFRHNLGYTCIMIALHWT